MANPSMDRDLVAWLRGQLQEAHAASSRHVMELFVDPPESYRYFLERLRAKQL